MFQWQISITSMQLMVRETVTGLFLIVGPIISGDQVYIINDEGKLIAMMRKLQKYIGLIYQSIEKRKKRRI